MTVGAPRDPYREARLENDLAGYRPKSQESPLA